MKIFSYFKTPNHIILKLFGMKIAFKINPNKKYYKPVVDGKNNKIIILNSKNKKIPPNLKIEILGCNNVIELEYPITFCGTNKITVRGDDNVFSVKRTIHEIYDTEFYLTDGGKIIIGENTSINENCLFIANNDFKEKHTIKLGKEVFVARDTIIRTSDGHTVIDISNNSKAINEPKNITIGNHVWIGTRCMVLKGSVISDNSILGACSLLNKSIQEQNVLIAGAPAKIVKKNITWDIKTYGEYMKDKISQTLSGGGRMIISFLINQIQLNINLV